MTPAPDKIKVLVVEDSPAVRLLLVHVLNSSTRLAVLGTAASGEEALALLERQRPDVIVMDIHMPGMDGYETTRRIMETQPVPIVVCSASLDPAEVAGTFRALDAGAVALVAKPAGPGHPEHEAMAAKLIETVTLMAEVKVVKRWARTSRRATPRAPIPPVAGAAVRIVAIGASTGGPPALHALLAGLPADFPLPLVIVQHIAAGFLPGLVEWLEQASGFPVKIAAHGEPLQAGRAFIAPDGNHLGVTASGRVALSRMPPENGLRPAVSHLFRSVAEAFGAKVAGVLLTGMGRDGAEELKRLRELGAVTFAQDAETSIVHGMPGEAIRLGGASFVLPPEKIAAALTSLARGRAAKAGQEFTE
jgi:two-component system chemotaxis response regulator CheB